MRYVLGDYYYTDDNQNESIFWVSVAIAILIAIAIFFMMIYAFCYPGDELTRTIIYHHYYHKDGDKESKTESNKK